MSWPWVGRDVIPCGACGSYVWLPQGCVHFGQRRGKSLSGKRQSNVWHYPPGLTPDQKRLIRGREYARVKRARRHQEPTTLPFLSKEYEYEHMRPWPNLERITARQAAERMAAGIYCSHCRAANKKLMIHGKDFICMGCLRTERKRSE